MSSTPRPRLRCPVCGGAPRLPRDLRQPLRCACGASLRLALVQSDTGKPATGAAGMKVAWPLDMPALARFANKRMMRTDDLLLTASALILALEGKDKTVTMLESQLKRIRHDQVIPPRYLQ